jgi:hypothetical protein
MKHFFLVILMIVATSLRAQEGKVIINADPEVDQLVTLHKEHNQVYPYVQGYRIQLFKDSGNDALNAAHQMMEKFKKQFPDLNVYLSFKEPYYRVRVGDFRTRIEALDRLQDIKRKYRSVWIIKDNIHFSDYRNKDAGDIYEINKNIKN